MHSTHSRVSVGVSGYQVALKQKTYHSGFRRPLLGLEKDRLVFSAGRTQLVRSRELERSVCDGQPEFTPIVS